MKKVFKKAVAVVMALATCSAISAGITSAFDGTVKADTQQSTSLLSENGSEFVYDDLYDLHAEVTKSPDSTFISDSGEPDFTGMTITVYAIGADGSNNAVLTDASLDEVRELYEVNVSMEPMDPTGFMCTITISAFSNAMNETVSTSLIVNFKEPIKSNALSELRMEITKKPNDTIIHGDSELDLTGMTISVYEINAEGNETQTLSDATLDEVREKYRVDVDIEDEAPGSGICTITIWAYSEVYYRDIYASASFDITYGAPLPTTEPTTEPEPTTEETTTTTSPVPDYLRGDVNADGEFSVTDVILLQKWLLAVPDTKLANWKAADFYEDERLDVFDLCLMKRELVSSKEEEVYPVKKPEVIDEFTPCTATLEDEFDIWAIHIIIKHQYSVPERVWTMEDFAGVDNMKRMEQYSLGSPYRQMLEISLKDPSKENVLKLIHDIEALNLAEIKEIQVFSYSMGA